MKTNKCIDCNKKIKHSSTRCKSCARKGSNNTAWKGGISNVKCVDCNKEISTIEAKRCRSCAGKFNGLLQKGINNPNYKHGLTTVSNYCIDCKTEISKNPNAKRCNSCCRFGILSSTYKDGRTKISESIRKSLNNYKWKDYIFNRDNYTCCDCGKLGGNLEVDHIKPFSIILSEFLKTYSQFSPIEDKETLLRLAVNYAPFWDINNGRTLCISCHRVKTSKDIKIIRNK